MFPVSHRDLPIDCLKTFTGVTVREVNNNQGGWILCVVICYRNISAGVAHHRIIQWFGLEETFKDHLVWHLAWCDVAKYSVQPDLGHFQPWACAISLGNLLHCFTALIIRDFFLITSLNINFILKLSSLVRGPDNKSFSISPSFLRAPFSYWKTAIRSPWSLLLSRLNNPNSLCLSSQERGSSPLNTFVAPSLTVKPRTSQ